MLLDNKGLMLLEVRIFWLKNNTLNEYIFNTKQKENNKKWLIFWYIFFNLLTY